MPQDGSNNYYYPLGTPGVPDQTIESEAYNTFIDDLVINDLNWPRPVHRGGTGATTALDARTNLGTDVSSLQQIVTNYDSHVWQSGSFSSFDGATAAPTAGAHFTGTCTPLTDDQQYITLRATGSATGISYVRQRNAGVWGAWIQQASGLADIVDAAEITYVNLTGDTMSGYLSLLGQVSGDHAVRKDYVDAADTTIINAFNAADAALNAADTALDSAKVNRSGDTITGSLNVNGNLTGGGTPPGGVTINSSGTNKFVAFTASEYFMFGTDDSTMRYRLANVDRFYVPGATGHLHVASNGYKPGGGVWGDSSDVRIKNVLGDYGNGLDEILALHPVRYTFKGNDTFGPPEHLSQLDENRNALPRSTEPLTAPYPNSPHHWAATEGIEYVGLIAQEAETASPDMVTQHAGYIDGQPVADIRDLDTTALIFKLVNAVKTLNARIEALESA